jgi:hypothetical protein
VPELRHHRRELFARFLADGHSQSESYELSGYRPSTANASTLANAPEVKARVEELKAEKDRQKVELASKLKDLGLEPNCSPDIFGEAEEIVKWTVGMVQTELFKNARLAQAAGEFTAAAKSLELLGKSIGMWESDNKAGKLNGPEKPQVSLTFINEATERLESAGRGESAKVVSPLAPRVSNAP